MSNPLLARLNKIDENLSALTSKMAALIDGLDDGIYNDEVQAVSSAYSDIDSEIIELIESLMAAAIND